MADSQYNTLTDDPQHELLRWLDYVPPPTDDDREMVLAYFEWLSLDQEQTDAETAYRRDGIEYDGAESEARLDRMHAIEDEIMATEPRSWMGVWCLVRLAFNQLCTKEYPPPWSADAPRKVDDFYPVDRPCVLAAVHATRLLLLERRHKAGLKVRS